MVWFGFKVRTLHKYETKSSSVQCEGGTEQLNSVRAWDEVERPVEFVLTRFICKSEGLCTVHVHFQSILCHFHSFSIFSRQYTSFLKLHALSDQGLKPEDIHYVICLNGHIEQIGNLNLFSGAVQCVGYDICRHDQYLLHELKEGMPFNIDEDVEIGPTPGHTGNDVLVVVKKANLGVLAGVGWLFFLLLLLGGVRKVQPFA
ncbi:uncharacterized protein LOC129927701 [Biomphalaria glabrata]|uniref:Uncharacterized protein LOC129927701 n=1 Tax=Biomphalaria glabrata TaxID=6526 RepID=A0A9W3B3E9_BIOGL|nr:uncharacterized protein LOC129927701 [Biomphalaria glabrata]